MNGNQAKTRGRKATYADDIVSAVVADLRKGAPRPNRYEIARKHSVGVSFVNYRWKLIRHEYEKPSEGEAA